MVIHANCNNLAKYKVNNNTRLYPSSTSYKRNGSSSIAELLPFVKKHVGLAMVSNTVARLYLCLRDQSCFFQTRPKCWRAFNTPSSSTDVVT